MKKVYEAPVAEAIRFAQEAVLAPSGEVSANLMNNSNAILGSGTGSNTQNSDTISGGVSLW